MVQACVALLAGAYALQLSSIPVAVACICLASVSLALARRWYALCFGACGVALFAITATLVIDKRLAPEFEGDSILTVVRVVDFPKMADSTVSLLIAPVDDRRLPARVRVSWHEPHAEPRLGDIWQFELRLRRPRGSRNPGTFDYETWLFRERVGATGYVVPGKRNRLQAVDSALPIDKFRQRLVGRIDRAVSDDSTASLLIAIITGARHRISKEQWQRFAMTGTSHLMAISGLHVGLAALAAYVGAGMALAATGVRQNNHEHALVFSLLAAGVYVVISGFAVPAQRAWLMLAIGTLTALRRRQLHASLVLSATCFAVVLFNPLATMQPGFKLSFAAVIALLWMAKMRPTGSAVMRVVAMQLILMMGLAALTALLFHRIALYAVPVNLIAVPVFTFVTIPAAFVGVITGADMALAISAQTLGWIEWLIVFVTRLPGADLKLAAVQGAAWIYVAVPVLWAVLPPGWPCRRAAWLGLFALVFFRPAAPAFGCAQATVLDVGQGLAVVLQTHRHTALYDTGPSFRGGGSAAERAVQPFLRAAGISRIDRLIVSHDDLDHAGGLDFLLARLSVDEVLTGEPTDGGDRSHRRCEEGQHWHWDGIDFRILHPPMGGEFDGNDASCVLLVEAGRHRLLITGDIEVAAERRLVRDGVLLPVDVLTVPHHGSRTSSSAPFADRTVPNWAIGERNWYSTARENGKA